MTDDNSNRGESDDQARTPPPLVPPPVRRDETGEQVPVVARDSDGSNQPLFVEPSADRAGERSGAEAARPSTSDDSSPDRPADPAYAEPSVTDEPAGSVRDEDADDDADLAGSQQPYQPVSARSSAPVDPQPEYQRPDPQPEYRGSTDRSGAPEQRSTDEYRPATAPQPDRTESYDAATARQEVRDTSRDAETVAVAAPSTSPAATPQPMLVPASEGGVERTAGFPPATGGQREFIQPPVAPKKKGNRGIGALIALLSVVLFAVLYALVAIAVIAARQPAGLGESVTTFVSLPLYWVPGIIFVVAFVVVALLANRAGWWAYVLGSLLVGATVYFGTIGVALITDDVVSMTAREAFDSFLGYVANPFIIAAGLVAREVSLWTGSAIAARGRRVKERNVSAKNEYERATAEHRAEYERTYSSRS